MSGEVLVPDQCAICERGKYLALATNRCENYTDTLIDNCFNYFGNGGIFLSCMICEAGKAPTSTFTRRRILTGTEEILCTDDTQVENCDLTAMVPGSDTSSNFCLSCKEDYYLIDGQCTGKATGDLKGCHEGTATSCNVCNPYFDYVMYLPGRCAKKSEITEEFMMKAREMASLSQMIPASLIGLLLFVMFQL